MTLALTGNLSRFMSGHRGDQGLVGRPILACAAPGRHIMPSDRLIGRSVFANHDGYRAHAVAERRRIVRFPSAWAGYVAIVSLYVLSALLTLCVVAPSSRTRSTRRLMRCCGVAAARLRRAWLTLDHAAVRGDLDRVSQPAAYPLSNGLLPYVAREIYRTNQTGLAIFGEFRVGCWSLGSAEPDRRPACCAADDRAPRYGYVTLLVFVQMKTMRPRCLPDAGGVLAKPGHDLDRRDPDADASAHFRGRVMGVRMSPFQLPIGLSAAGA